MTSSPPLTVSVVIPVLDGADVLSGCLDAIAQQTLDPAMIEVIVVDNGSVDRTAAVAADHPRADVIVHASAPGSYRARNAGIAVATGAVLSFTDADCTPHAGWLAQAVGVLVEQEGLAAVAGRVTPVASAQPTPWERYDRAMYLDQAAHVAGEGFGATANLHVRAGTFRRVGPFDASLRSSGDLEWGLRLRAAGLQLGYVDGAVVGHRPRRTAGETWGLHHRLGRGWAELARRGLRAPGLDDPALLQPLGEVVDRVARDGPPLRRRQLVVPHATASVARVVGKLGG